MSEINTFYRIETEDKNQAINLFIKHFSGRFKNLIPSATKPYKIAVGKCMVKGCDIEKSLHFAHSHKEDRRRIITNIIFTYDFIKEIEGGYEFHTSEIFKKYRLYHLKPTNTFTIYFAPIIIRTKSMVMTKQWIRTLGF
ncbi:hypothetical protein K3L72_17270 [Bacillus altitudinis]|uniref:hypothetical protein n=1 Tax=Bacillus altitudinis TaxID=293387 RepID=UPI0022367701|nr:hypothetical protein [Bacillus altitudinis]MCW4359530.1 hypothetical protein [Bacillus altitudinis]